MSRTEDWLDLWSARPKAVKNKRSSVMDDCLFVVISVFESWHNAAARRAQGFSHLRLHPCQFLQMKIWCVFHVSFVAHHITFDVVVIGAVPVNAVKVCKWSRAQYNETSVMHISFSLLRIKGLYMFRTSFAHLQEVPHKRHLVYCMRIMSVCCATIEVKLQSWHNQLTFYARSIPSAVCAGPPRDEQVA
jgi:hypothetical protein